MLRTLDVFTGIGGFSLALSEVASPLAFCEIDPWAIRMLQSRMAEGKLPRTPICQDVALLSPTWLKEHCEEQVDLITAGFPCQGFSTMGHQKGYAHESSSLYEHVVRLVQEFRPPLLLLENVPEILRLGQDHVIETLCLHCNYELRWMVLGAHDVGAPHTRRRWFCLGIDSQQPSAYALLDQGSF